MNPRIFREYDIRCNAVALVTRCEARAPQRLAEIRAVLEVHVKIARRAR